MKKNKLLLRFLLVASILGLGMFFISPASLGFSGFQTYDDFIIGKFDVSKWNLMFPDGELGTSSREEDGVLRVSTERSFKASSVQEFKGNDLKFSYVVANTQFDSKGNQVCARGGCGNALLGVDFGVCSVGVEHFDQNPPVSGTFELESSRINPDEFIVLHNNRVVCEGVDPSSVVVDYSFKGGNFGNVNVYKISPLLFKVPFSCVLGENEFLAAESFNGGDVFSTRYPVRKFCLDHPVIIVDSIMGGTDVSAEPYENLVRGENVVVPEQQVWTVFYIFKNEDRDGNKIFQTACDFKNQYLDVNSDKCVDQGGFIQVCSDGVFDPVRKVCIVTSDPVCSRGVFDTSTGECVINVPSLLQVCAEGSLQSDGTCSAPLNVECPLGYERFDISSTEIQCVKVVSDVTEKILAPVEVVRSEFDLSRGELLLVILGFFGILTVLVVLGVGRR